MNNAFGCLHATSCTLVLLVFILELPCSQFRRSLGGYHIYRYNILTAWSLSLAPISLCKALFNGNQLITRP